MAQFAQFKQEMDAWFGLKWTFTEPASTVDFMDLTISIVNGRIETTLFEKAQNLYLYIPPHSSHPKGVTTGLIMGQVLRIRRLCSKRADANEKIKQFVAGRSCHFKKLHLLHLSFFMLDMLKQWNC